MSDSTATVGLQITLQDMASAGLANLSTLLKGVGDSSVVISDSFSTFSKSANKAQKGLEGVSNTLLPIVTGMDNLKPYLTDINDLFGTLATNSDTVASAFRSLSSTWRSLVNSADDLELAVKAVDESFAAAKPTVDELGTSIKFINENSDQAVVAIDSMSEALSAQADAANAANDAEHGLNNGFILGMGLSQGAGSVFNFLKGQILNAVGAYGDLQASLTNLQNITGLSDQQMQALSVTIENLAGNSQFTATTVSDAYAAMAMNGYTATEKLGNSAINLATALQSDLAPAADLLTHTMLAFGASQDQAEYYSSVLTFAVQHGAQTIGNLQEALQGAAGEAHTMGIPFNDLAGTLDILMRSGLDAQISGTGLRYMISALSSPTTKAATELKKLGISTYDLNGNLLSLPQLVGELSDKLKGLPQDKQIAALGAIFTVRGAQAALKLMSDPNIKANLDAMIKGAGNAGSTDIAQTEKDKNRGDWHTQLGALTTSITTFMGDAAKPFTEWLGHQADLLNIWIGALQTTNPKLKEFVAIFTGIATLGSGLGMIAGMAIMFGSASIVIAAFVVAAIGLGLAGAWLYQHWGQVVPVFQHVWAIAQQVGNVLLSIGIAVGIVAGGYFLLTPAVGGAIISMIAYGATTLAAVSLSSIVSIALALRTVVTWALNSAQWSASLSGWAMLAPAILMVGVWILIIGIGIAMVVGLAMLIQHFGAMKLIMIGVHLVIAALTNVFQLIVHAIKDDLSSALTGLRPLWGQIVTLFQQTIPAFKGLGVVLAILAAIIVAVLWGVLRGVLMALGALIGGLIHIVGGILQVLAGLIIFVLGFFKIIVSIFHGNWGGAIDGLKQMGAGIFLIFSGIFNVVIGIIGTFVKVILAFIMGLVQGVIGFFTTLADVLYKHSIIPDMVNAIVGIFRGFGQMVLSIIMALIQGFINLFIILPIRVLMIILLLISTIVGALSTGGNQISTFVHNSIVQPIINAINSLVGMATGFGSNFINMLRQGIMNGISGLLGAVGGAAQGIKNLLGFHSPTKDGPLSDSDQYMPNMMRMMGAGIRGNQHHVIGAVRDVAGGIAHGISTPAVSTIQSAGGGSQGNTSTINLNVDGKTVGTAVFNHLTGQMQLNGMTRSWR